MSESILRKPIIEKNRIVRLRAYARNRPKSTSPSPDDLLTLNESLKSHISIRQDKTSPKYLNQIIKRLLYPTVDCYNFRDALPNLTSSNDVVDLYLYPLVGLLLKNFVNSWYGNISDDTEFISQLLVVISKITRDLEKRLANLNLLEFLLDDIPLVLDNHLKIYSKVINELGSVFLPYDTIDAAFDHLDCHKALTDDPGDEDLYLRILSGQLLDKLLPKEELNSSLASSFVNTLFSDLLLRITIDKLSQPYQIFEIITKICNSIVNEEVEPETETNKINNNTGNSFTLIIYKVLSKLSHFVVLSTSINNSTTRGNSPLSSISSLYIFEFLNNFVQLYKHRPILYTCLVSASIILKTEIVNHFLTNILSNTVLKYLKSESLTIKILQIIRNNLFPEDDQMGPARIEPDLEEYEQIRTTTKQSLLKLAKNYRIFTKIVLCDDLDVELDNILEDFLTSLENKRLNKHLIYRLMDLIIVRLVPEMSAEH